MRFWRPPFYQLNYAPMMLVEGEGFEPSKLPQRIYSPPHLATLVSLRVGASDRNRTRDLLITSQLLYLLSYAGIRGDRF